MMGNEWPIYLNLTEASLNGLPLVACMHLSYALGVSDWKSREKVLNLLIQLVSDIVNTTCEKYQTSICRLNLYFCI